MAEAIKTKVLLNKPDGSKEEAERVLLALTDDEALSLRMACWAVGGKKANTRHKHFTVGEGCIEKVLLGAGVNLPGGDAGYDYEEYVEGSILFKK